MQKRARSITYALLSIAIIFIIMAKAGDSFADIVYTDPNAWTHVQVTNNSTDDFWATASSNGALAWMHDDGNDWEIMYWDGQLTSVPVQITNNSYDDYYPSVSYSQPLSTNQIAWHALDPTDGDNEIYFWNGTSTTKITNNTQHDYYASLDNGTIAYEHQIQVGLALRQDIYYWDGATTIQVTDTADDYMEKYTSISLYDGQIAWTERYCEPGQPITDYELMFWDGATIYQVTNDTYEDQIVSLYNGAIAWSSTAPTGGSWEIYYWDGAFPITIDRITNNSVDDVMPTLYGENIVFYRGGNPQGIWLYDISTATEGLLVPGNVRNGYYNGLYIAYEKYDTTDMDWEIWRTHCPELPPGALQMLTVLLGAGATWAKRLFKK